MNTYVLYIPTPQELNLGQCLCTKHAVAWGSLSHLNPDTMGPFCLAIEDKQLGLPGLQELDKVLKVYEKMDFTCWMYVSASGI